MKTPAAAADYAECAYCGHTTRNIAPALNDDAAWAVLAREHAGDCEWVATHAHRRDTPTRAPGASTD